MGTVHNPPAVIPRVIRLPDGREIATHDLMGKIHNQVNINVRTGYRGNNSRGVARISDDERRFRAMATVEEIQQRYGCDLHRARNMRSMSRRQLGIPTRAQVPST